MLQRLVFPHNSKRTWTVRGPDPNRRELSTSEFAVLEEGVQSASNMPSPSVDLPVCEPRKVGCKLQWVFGQNTPFA